MFYLLVICSLLIVTEYVRDDSSYFETMTEFLFLTLVVFPGLLPVYIPLFGAYLLCMALLFL